MPDFEQVIERFNALEKERRRIEAQLKDLLSQREILENQLLDLFADTGIDHVRMNGLTHYLQVEFWGGAEDGNYPRACAALRKAGLGSMVEERFNTNTLSAWLRERIRAGEEVPAVFDGAIRISQVSRVKTRKGD